MITLVQEQGNNGQTKEIDGSRKRQSRKACKRAMLRYSWALSEGTGLTKTKLTHVLVYIVYIGHILWTSVLHLLSYIEQIALLARGCELP